MKIFKHKENGKSYIIYIQMSAYPYLDGSDRLGVWAHPYLNKEDLHNFFRWSFYERAVAIRSKIIGATDWRKNYVVCS